MTNQTSMDDVQTYDPNDIAVIGMSCRLPGARNVQEYWQNLLEGKEALTELNDEQLRASGVPESDRQDPNYVKAGMFLEDMECFDAAFFGLSQQDARIMDPQHRHFLECAWEAFEDAGYIPNDIDATVGVYAGSGHNAYLPYNILTNPELKEQLGFFLLRHTGNDKDFLSTRASYIFNWKGPSLNIQTACSTSLVAIHMAAQSLLNGECEMALAGGVTIELPHRQGYVYKENEILSKDGHCRPFEAASGGTVFGSGAGCVVLKRLEDAVADGDQIHAVIKSSAINNDGAGKVSYLAPSIDGQAIAAGDALAIGEIDPRSVEFIECHGTGTAMGDPIEVAALTQAYGADNPATQYCALGSVKSNIGHTDTAAGVAGFIKTVLCLKYQKLVPTLHFDAPNPQIDFASSPFYVNDRLREWHSEQPRRAAVSSLGVGGTNAHVILEEAPQISSAAATPSESDCDTLAISARTPAALGQYTQRYSEYLGSLSDQVSLRDIAASAIQTRASFSERTVCVASDKAKMQAVLDDSKHALRATHKAAEFTKLSFMFAGGGAQYPNMGLGLYQTQPVYRNALDGCLNAARSILDYDLRSVLFPTEEGLEQAKSELLRPTRALPSLFVTQWAQAQLWKSWGIEPETMIGHSMGEYTAAALAGVFDMPSALAIVAKRGELFETLPSGAMLSVMLEMDKLLELMPAELSIAAQNSQALTVVAGPTASIESFQEFLETRDIQCRRVMISVAAHSAMLDPILAPFETFLRTIDYKAPEIKIASNLTGKWLSDEDATDPSYWVKHLRETVRFSDGLSLLLAVEEGTQPVLMEIGPGNTLASLSRQHNLVTKDTMVTASMRHPKEQVDDLAFMRLAQGKLWCAGVDLSWGELYAPTTQKLSLPTYPFERHRHWIEPGNRTESSAQVKDLSDWFYTQSFAAQPHCGTLETAADSRFFLLAENSQFRSELMGLKFWDDSSSELSEIIPKLKTVELPVLCYVPTFSTPSQDPSYEDELQTLKRLYELGQALCDVGLEGLKLNILGLERLSVHPSENQTPMMSALAAASRVLAHECAGLSVKVVDMDAMTMHLNVLERGQLQIECAEHAHRFETVVYRQGARFVERFSQMSLPDVTDSLSSGSESVFAGTEASNVCVITGGLGGLGLTLAEQLSRRSKVKLALLTHREFPDASQWAELVGKPGRIGQRAKALMDLSRRVDELKLYVVDVSEQERLIECVSQISRSMGPIRNVFHTAGAIDDQLLSMKTWPRCEAVLAPKIRGAKNLALACKDFDLEHFVLYSSVSAQTGMVGQFDYAAANGYLDAFAKGLKQQGIPAVSVNWSAWQEVGMAAELADGRRSMGASYPPFDDYCSDNSVEIYLDDQRWWIDEHRTRAGLALMPGTGFLNHIAKAFQMYSQRSLAIDDGASEASLALHISNCFFAAPLVFAQNEQKVMSVEFSRSFDTGEIQFQVYSAHDAIAAEKRDYIAEHVSGSVSWEPMSSSQICLSELIAEADLSVDLKGQIDHAHMAFGPRWGVLHRVYRGQGYCLAELKLESGFYGDLGECLHPAILDMATGIAHQLAPDYQPERDFYVPVSYSKLSIHKGLKGEGWSYARWLRDEGDDSTFDITIADREGHVIVDIEGFRAKRMPANALDQLEQSVTDMSSLDVDLSKSIRPSQGQSALKRILHWSQDAQVLVSPQDFSHIIQQRNVLATSGPNSGSQVYRADLESQFAAPKTQVQLRLLELWSRALGAEDLGIDDNFFELGGHSLLLTQLATKAKKLLGTQVALSKLFENPTIADWAGYAKNDSPLDSGSQDLRASGDAETLSNQQQPFVEGQFKPKNNIDIKSLDRDGNRFSAPLSPTQSALWYAHEMSGGSSAYHIPLAVKFDAQVDVQALQRALSTLQSRHEILRTTYAEENGVLMQQVHSELTLPFEHVDVGSVELEGEMQSAIEAPFDLLKASSLRIVLFDVMPEAASDAEYSVLLLNFHHIAIDHTALLALMIELEQLYAAALSKCEPDLPQPELQFSDYANWLNEYLTDTSDQLEAKMRVWAARLDGFSGVLDLPFDHSRPSVPSGKGAQFLFSFTPELSSKVESFSKVQSVSLFSSLLASLKVLLHRYSGQDDVIVGTPFANRGDLEVLQSVVGCFINTLPLASRMSDSKDYLSLIDQVTSVMFEAYDNQDVPLNLIADAAKISRDPSYSPLFQVGFIFQEPPGSLALEGLRSELLPVHSGGAMYDLHIWCWLEGEQLKGVVWYNTDVYELSSIERMQAHWESLLGQLVASPGADFRSFPLLLEHEKSSISASNTTSVDVDFSVMLPALFVRQAQATPARTAVSCQGASLSYETLASRVTQLAHYLREQGVQRGDKVGVSLARSNDLLVSVLAVMQAGACYVPMDPNYPEERLRYMVEQADVAVLLSGESVVDRLGYFEGRIIQVDAHWAEIESAPSGELPTVGADDLAYIIFTSGSTGLPKGVQVPHKGVVNFLNAMSEAPGLNEEDKLLAITTLSFDIAVLELYLPLLNGAHVVLATEDEVIDGHALKGLIERHKVSVMQATPSTWRMLLAAGWQGECSFQHGRGLKALCGGEPFPIDLAQTLTDCCAEVWNMYGPTETTVWSVCRQVHSEKPNIIGHPIGNTQCYVLNEYGQEQATGLLGELYIGGAGVTQGYLNRPDLTEQAFVRVEGLEGLLYRTGDAVKRLANGELEYVQRLDSQVKVRGYRIELGEIESTILKLAQVSSCAVLVREYNVSDKRIVAYVEFVDEAQSLTMSELRRYMRDYLPDYMIPQQLVEMAQMPLTPNGKIDRKALPETSLSEQPDGAPKAPSTEHERTIHAIWQEVLGATHLGVSDNFFELGGHSLLLVNAAGKVQQAFSTPCPLSSLIAEPTIEAWAQQFDGVESAQVDRTIAQVDRVLSDSSAAFGGMFECDLSPTQRALYFVHLSAPESHAYNLPVFVRFEHAVGEDFLKRALNWVVNRHEILRTKYRQDVKGMRQCVFSKIEIDCPVLAMDASEYMGAIQDFALRTFDLQNDFPVRAQILRSADSDVVCLNFHHIAVDQTSLMYVLESLQSAYRSLSVGEVLSSEQTDMLHYVDYVDWLKRERNSLVHVEELNVWARRLNSFSGVLDLPFDRARPAVPSGKGRGLSFVFSREHSAALKAFTASQGVSLYHALLSSFGILMQRYTSQNDVIVGTPFANRGSLPELHDLVGCFINTLPLAIDLSNTLSFEHVLMHVKEVLLEAFDLQHVPLADIVEKTHVKRDLSYNPLFQVVFVFQNAPPNLLLDGQKGELLSFPDVGAMYDLHVWCWEDDNGISSQIIFNTDVYESTTIERMQQHWQCLLEALIESPHADYRRLSILSQSEIKGIEEANERHIERDYSSTLPNIFDKQAEQSPERCAVECAGVQLSYRELSERSTRLACYLLDQGIQQGDKVGVSMSRSTDMLVATLAVMKAGACYVPMDPSYPEDRLAYMVDQAEVNVVLTNDSVKDELAYFDGNAISVDGEWPHIETIELSALPSVKSDDLAYIIFTSGSTGLPKGVKVPHKGVLNFLESMALEPGFQAQDTLLAITTLSFDIAVLELYLPLIVGGKVVIATEDQAIDGQELKQLIRAHNVSVMQATPATWRTLLASDWNGGLKVLCGGEPFPIDLAKALSDCCPEVWNMYGPTETTVWSLCRKVDVNKPNIIGLPIENTQCYVLSESGVEQPIGVSGELFIGGDGVTKGYLNRQDLTDKAFTEVDGIEGLLYRTGDAVKRLPTGELEYVQRLDNQVKVRGYRIELGEIEATILKHPDVAECAVLVKEFSAADKRIVAYAKFVDASKALTMSSMRRHLRHYLPDYMIPQQLVEMAIMPLTQNGKIDRKSLPDVSKPRTQIGQSKAPKTPQQVALAKIWSDVLDIDSVELDQFFFDIGGHSMLSLDVISRVQHQFDTRIKPADMVLNTLEQLAAMLPDQSDPASSVSDNEQMSNQSDSNSGSNFYRKEGLFSRLFRRKK